VLVALQRTQAASILRCTIVASEDSSFPFLLSLSHMLLASDEGFGNIICSFAPFNPLSILCAFWLGLGSSLFVLPFPPLLSALFHKVYQGFII